MTTCARTTCFGSTGWCRARSRRRAIAGVSLVEMLAAIAVFVVVYLLAMDVWSMGAHASEQARNVMMATQLAEQQMEYSVYQGYGSVSPGSGSSTTTAVVNGVSRSTTYTYAVAVSSSGANTKDVVVTVTWSEPAARPSSPRIQRSIQLETLLDATM